MKKNVSVVFSLIGILGLFIPFITVAGNMNLFFYISNIGGISYALYLLVPAVAIVSILRKYKPFSGDRIWLIGTSSTTIFIAFIVRFLYGHSLQNDVPHLKGAIVGSGLGAIAILFTSFVITVLVFLDKTEKNKLLED